MVSNNIFEQHTFPPIAVTWNLTADFSNNTFVDNQMNAIGLIKPNFNPAGDYVLDAVKEDAIDSLFYVPLNTLTVETGATLTIRPGLLFKNVYSYSGFVINGTLIAEGTPNQPIVFTSLRDDEYAGDSNGDENSSCPTLGEWDGLSLNSAAVNSRVRGCVVRFAYEALGIGNSTTQISNNVLSQSTYGLVVGGGATVEVDSCIVKQNGKGIYSTNGAMLTISHSAIYDNTTYDIHNFSTQPVSAPFNWWGAAHTNEMTTGGPGQNLPYLYDHEDDASRGAVSYYPPLSAAPQLDAPPAVQPISFTYEITGNEVQFYLTSLNQANNYLWDFGDGTTSTELNPVYTYTGTGPFIVTLLNELCYETLVLVQVVNLSVATNEPSKGQWLLYPNPTAEALYVQTKAVADAFPFELSLYDVMGSLVHQQMLHQADERVDLSRLQAGFYVCQLRSTETAQQLGLPLTFQKF